MIQQFGLRLSLSTCWHWSGLVRLPSYLCLDLSLLGDTVLCCLLYCGSQACLLPISVFYRVLAFYFLRSAILKSEKYCERFHRQIEGHLIDLNLLNRWITRTKLIWNRSSTRKVNRYKEEERRAITIWICLGINQLRGLLWYSCICGSSVSSFIF